MEKKILGLVEMVKINGKHILGRVDTGARRCSIDRVLAEELELGPVVGSKRFKSAHGKSVRPVIKEKISIKGRKIKVKINLSNRSHMKYPFLIGREALKKEFLIDPNK